MLHPDCFDLGKITVWINSVTFDRDQALGEVLAVEYRLAVPVAVPISS